MSTGNYKKIIILCFCLALGIIVVSVIFALKKDDGKKTGKKDSGTVTQIPFDDKNITETEAIITDIDLDASEITVEPLTGGESLTLFYTGGSDMKTKTGRIISAAVLSRGNIVRIGYEEDRLVYLYGHDGVWSYKNAVNISLDVGIGKIEVGTDVYRFGENMKVLNNKEFTGTESLLLNGTDMVDLYGLGDKVYLIRVSAGHGYLTLTGAEDFMGGTVSYGLGKSAAVTEDLKLTLREGDYDITVENNGCTAEATVRIRNGETTAFDLTGYGPEPIEYCSVTFKITPEESDLYIDGVKHLHNNPIDIPYGYHEIEVALGGYTTYKGSIEAGSEESVKRIALSPRPEEPDEDIIYEDAGASGENENVAGNVSPTPAADNNNTSPDTGKDNDKSGTVTDYPDVDIPDSTTDTGDNGKLEVIDGDGDDSQGSDTGDDNSSGNGDDAKDADDTGDDNSSGNGDDAQDNAQNSGRMILFCSEGAKVYVNGVYKGTVTDGSLELSKPSGTFELELKKDGYVTKKYTLTTDPGEEEETFKFPALTPEKQ